MSKEQMEAMLSETGIPYAYYLFEEGTIQPPYMVWYYGETQNFYADGTIYMAINTVVIELYCDECNMNLEGKVDAVLDNHGIGFKKQREYISDEHMFETIFIMEVLSDGK